MANKTAKVPLGGVHTAGIYADMTVDGPEIGTLVVVVDRAKNLPNRRAMGKQDPYCAARLGKEAKKTETDKRGGQTPRWDQELRFTVHDSPDYYQLKVSVFNDDKKTELIGECWVALDSIVVRGGAQNDIWHNLNCKGRYAGEIRIELTYYDTRPRETKVEERRQSTQIDGATEMGREENIGGPRQPKPVKRRPLPADPTGLPGPASVPATPPMQQQHHQYHQDPLQQRYVDSPEDYQLYTPPQERQYQQSEDLAPQASSSDHQYRGERHSESTSPAMPKPGRSSPSHQRINNRSTHESYEQPNVMMHGQKPKSQQAYDLGSEYEQEFQSDTFNPLHSSQVSAYPTPSPTATPPHYVSTPQPLRPPPGSMQSRASPKGIAPLNYQRSSLSQSVGIEDESLIPMPSSHNSYEAWPESQEPESVNFDEDTPPAPPAHRMSTSTTSSHVNSYHDFQTSNFITAAAPRNIPVEGGSISGSPLSQVHSLPFDQGQEPSTSLSKSHRPSYPESPLSVHSPYTPLKPGRSGSPIRDSCQSLPPSLVPGYEPSVAVDESGRMSHEKHRNVRQQYAIPPAPPYQQETATVPQARPSGVHGDVDAGHERRIHHNSAHTWERRAASSDPRTPLRKSVSPQPNPAPGEQRRSELPFSPESFDALNPNMGSAAEVNKIGARYDTPDRAREASIQHDRGVKDEDAPIIGSDGRIIDPSDHLPTDTWAPEPEQKAPRKGPEITLRFRHSPQGAQPMPSAGRRSLVEGRPNAMSSANYTYSSNHSPTSTARARLQKKSRGNMVQPGSSPIAPTVSTSIPPRSAMPRASTTDYPLREHHQSSGKHGSVTIYGNGSHEDNPPPVPGKIPLRSGQGDYDKDSLSEEMSRIDIGVGGGQRSRVRRYGF
ncbi:MAG: hypothetical protein Q9163_005500 [Psora crenata]